MFIIYNYYTSIITPTLVVRVIYLLDRVRLSFDGSGFGLGKRGKRFAMIVDRGFICHLAVEEKGSFSVSSAESILKALDSI